MLSYQTVEPYTLELLKGLSAEPVLASTRLVGGTALALQYGHRNSIDLDSIFRALMSISYFEDADNQFMPVMFVPVTWEEMRETILESVRSYAHH